MSHSIARAVGLWPAGSRLLVRLALITGHTYSGAAEEPESDGEPESDDDDE